MARGIDGAEAGLRATSPFGGMSQRTDAGPQLLRHWINRAAQRQPDKICILSVDQDRQITYRQLQQLTRQVATFLHSRGIETNDRVVLLANNSIEHLVCYLGVMAYGATICTIHVEMNRNHLDNILPALNPHLVVFEEDLGLECATGAASASYLPLGSWDDRHSDGFYGAVRRCEPSDATAAESQERDDAVILFTSGTTERPKGVVLTFREILNNAGAAADGFDLTQADRIYDYRSFNWCSAQTLSALSPLKRGATLILGRKFTRSKFFDHIKTYGATIAAGTPTTINMLLAGGDSDGGVDVPTLRFITSSSAPLMDEEWRRFEEHFRIPIAQGYGSSETGWIAANPGEKRRFGTVGRPLVYHDLAIVDTEGRRLKCGTVGHVEIGGFADNEYRYLSSDGTMRVYSRGRLKTGDMGLLDDHGFLHLTGREKELIIRGGVNISPLEIDAILSEKGEIFEAATVGIPDRIWGEEVVSYVTLQQGAIVTGDDLLHYCQERLPAFKAPKQIIVIDDLPKTDRGKLDRKALVERWSRCRAP